MESQGPKAESCFVNKKIDKKKKALKSPVFPKLKVFMMDEVK
jgi:hypothetical protein